MVNDDDNKMYIIDDHVDSTWYGSKTYHNEVKWERRDMNVFTHTIEADRPISVEFIGDTAGQINVDSNKGVVLRGAILNPSGTTTITAGTSITQESDEARVTGRRIVLTAGTGIGSGTPIATDVSDGAGASLKAVTDSGVVRIKEIVGDLPVDEITSTHDIFGSGGAVSVDARGAILAADGYTGLVEGGVSTWMYCR